MRKLNVVAPELIKEWHPTLNGNLNPCDIPARTKKKFWWICVNNEKHVWEASTDNRTRGTGCPFCAGRKVLPEESFGSKYPEIAAEWNHDKNRNFTPYEVTVKSNYRVWWRCNKNPNHNWQTSISRRTAGTGCPFCTGQKLCKENSLAIVNPNLAKEWHPTLNGKLIPSKVSIKSDKSVFWQCLKSKDHKPWKAQVKQRNIKDAGCPECRERPTIPFKKSLAFINPELAKQIHPDLNDDNIASQVTPGSGQMLVWKCSVNPKHKWRSKVAHRSAGSGCPYCSTSVSKENRRLFSELNYVLGEFEVILEHRIDNRLSVDVAILDLKLYIEWDSFYHHKDRFDVDQRKTKRLTRSGFSCIRLRSLSLPWSDINNCEVIFHNDEIRIEHIQKILKIIMNLEPGLKENTFLRGYLRRKKWATPDPTLTDDYQRKLPISGRSLSDRFPEHSKFWHPEKNGRLLPGEVYSATHQIVHWRCLENTNHEWECGVNTFTGREPSCLFCRNFKPSDSYNLSFCHPGLLNEWAADLNKGIDPATLSPGTGKKFWWRCAKGHTWEATVHNRAKGTGCPYCCGKKVSSDNCLTFKNRELSSQWHPTLNGSLTPNDVTPGSHKRVWWICPSNQEHIWESTIKNRSKGRGCPHCPRAKK